MSDKNKEQRANDMKEAWASLALEGFKPSKYGKKVGQLYIDGKITAQEQVALIRAHYGLDTEPYPSRKQNQEAYELEPGQEGPGHERGLQVDATPSYR